MVHVDGTVTTCCLDELLENALGNLRESTLSELWYGALIESWRLAHAEGRFEDSGPACQRCNWRSAGALSEEELQEWLKRRSR